jgi:hypothetical protein
MPEPQGIGEVRQAARRISGNTRYPIRNIPQLIEAAGGEDSEFELLGKRHKVRDVRQLVPQDYFPIESEEELTDRLANLDVLRSDSPLRRTQLENEEPRGDRTPPSVQDRPPGRSDGPSTGKGVR